MSRTLLGSCLVFSLAACGPAVDPRTEATLAVKRDIDAQLTALHAASLALQAAAPAPDADGWNATADAAAVASMKAEWKKARIAYERVEGAIAVLFGELDASTDERYDGFVEVEKDSDLFDGQGVTGVHGVERILWSDSQPAHVIDFEAALPNYVTARFPQNAAEATAFKTGLLQRLVDDTKTMRDDFAPLALDSSAAFRGVIGSMAEQLEKVTLASTGEDESRYAQHTLADMRANLAGGEATYAHFSAWIVQSGGTKLDADIKAAFARVKAKYDALPGDAIPEVPAGWNEANPSAAHLATPYGELHTLLTNEANAEREGSLVNLMGQAADLVGIPQLPEQ